MPRRKRLFDYENKGIKFGMKKPAQNATQPEAQPMQETQSAQEVEPELQEEVAEEIHEFEVKANGEDHRLEFWLETLKNTKKTSHHTSFKRFFSKENSEQYYAVTNALSNVVDGTKLTFKEDRYSNINRVKTVSDMYFKLVDACETYLNKEGGKSKLGMARRGMVAAILKLAKEDITAVQQCYFDIYNHKISQEEQAKLTWAEILRGAREATIEVDDLHNDLVFKALGGNIKKDDKASRLLKKGVFTKENIADIKYSPNNFGNAEFGDRNEVGNDYGTETNVTNRNVATSRIAELLGLHGVVEESKTVKVRDYASGKVYKGNLMSVAKGEEAADAAAEVGNKAKVHGTDIGAREKTALSSFAPTIQKDLTSLQVLDYICGQSDRHMHNFFMEKDKSGKKYAHVHGIDNDASFSTGTKLDAYGSRFVLTRSKMRAVVHPDKNQLVIPYMDKQLAINIVNLSPDMVRFALKDLLHDRYVEKAIKRLQNVQEAIRNEEGGFDSPRFRAEGEWNDETADDMLQKSPYMKSFLAGKDQFDEKSAMESTYFAEMLLYAMGTDVGLTKFLDE